MIKKLLSIAAVAAIALSANANVDILDSFGTSGWSSSYEASTKTITYDEDWSGRGWWLTSEDGVTTDYSDYSAYTGIVIECEPLAAYAQIVVEYSTGENSSEGASAGATKIECKFDNDRKSSVKQIYLQSSAKGTIVLTGAYLVEDGDDNNQDVTVEPEQVLFEGEQLLDWYPGYEIDKTIIISAGAGAKLQVDVDYAGDGWSVKLGIKWTQDVLPSFAELDGFSTEWNTLWMSNKSWTYTFTDADIAALKSDSDSKLHVASEKTTTLKKLTLFSASETGSVSSIAVDNTAPVEYFNLQGVRVANPQNGLFIRRQGNTATKVLVK
jgi:hypothetical protein